MPIINDALSALTEWIALQSINPPLREISFAAMLPAAAYPQLAVQTREEVFAPHSQDTTAFVTLRIACSAGRPLDAWITLRSLAHQLRSLLTGSANLGGTVKHLSVGSIRYGEPATPTVPGDAPAIIATAEIDLELKYVQQ